MNIFGFCREYHRLLSAWSKPIPRPVRPEQKPIVFKSVRSEKAVFAPTHIHLRTLKLYMLTADGERLEVTGDEAHPLVEYQDSEGKRYAQRADRFHDGRFRELVR